MKKNIFWIIIILSINITRAQNPFTYYEIAENEGGFNLDLERGCRFGSSICLLDDLDNDGNNEIAVGAIGADAGAGDAGAVWILFMNDEGRVKDWHQIVYDDFQLEITAYGGINLGTVTPLGDIDGDTVPDIAIGGRGADGILLLDGDHYRQNMGAVYITLLNRDGSVKAVNTISDNVINKEMPGRNRIGGDSFFGAGLTTMQKAENGVAKLVVGYPDYYDEGGFMTIEVDKDTLQNIYYVNRLVNPPPFPLTIEMNFGEEIANIGDLDGDGIADLAVHAMRDDPVTGHYVGDELTYPFKDSTDGVVYILFMNEDHTIRDYKKLSRSENTLNSVMQKDELFGDGIATIGDLDGDGVQDLFISSSKKNNNNGTLYLLFMNRDGSVKRYLEFDHTSFGLISPSNLGESICNLGDINNDGLVEFAISHNAYERGGFFVVTYHAFSVEGYVIYDTIPVSEVVVQLIDDTGFTVDQIKPDSLGQFVFSGVVEGIYNFKVIPDDSVADLYVETEFPVSIAVDSHVVNLRIEIDDAMPIPSLPMFTKTAETSHTSAVNIFPNPVSDKIYIHATSEIKSVEIKNIMGESLFFSNSTNSAEASIAVQNLSSGSYFVEVCLVDGRREERWVVKE